MSFDQDYDEQGIAIVPLDSLLPSVLMRVSAIPYDLAVQMLRVKYNEFARKVGNVRMMLRIDVQKGVNRYPLPIPPGYFLHTVKAISFGRHHRGYRMALPDYWRGWNGMYRGQRYSIDESNALVLDMEPKRDEEQPIRVHVQLVPDADCLHMPADMAAMYGDAIAAGVAGEAMNIRGKPWYDPGNSVRVMKLFYQAITDARANAERDKLGVAYMRTRRWT
jgi:hypothetical protein